LVDLRSPGAVVRRLRKTPARAAARQPTAAAINPLTTAPSASRSCNAAWKGAFAAST